MPQGHWQLNDYQESGVTLPNVQGNIRFSPDSGNKTDWQILSSWICGATGLVTVIRGRCGMTQQDNILSA